MHEVSCLCVFFAGVLVKETETGTAVEVKAEKRAKNVIASAVYLLPLPLLNDPPTVVEVKAEKRAKNVIANAVYLLPLPLLNDPPDRHKRRRNHKGITITMGKGTARRLKWRQRIVEATMVLVQPKQMQTPNQVLHEHALVESTLY